LVAKGFTTADAVELSAQLSSTTAVVAANLTQLFTPDDRGYSKFNRSAIRFMPELCFLKIRDDSICPNTKIMIKKSIAAIPTLHGG
jgi:hypothetical protein